MTEDTSTTSTTSVDTSAPASAPAETSAPASSPPETSSPVAASWQDAFQAAGLTGESHPEADVPSPAPATAEPTAPVEPATPDPKGPIPFDRHEAILRNTREKVQQEVVGRVQQQYGPGIQFQQQFASDPTGTLTQLIDEAVQHPTLGPQVVSALARALGSRRKAAETIQPIETEIGQVYTADQVQALVQQQVAQAISPLEQERQSRLAEQQVAQERARTVQTVQSRLNAWREQPGFKEHEADIVTHQKALVEQGMDPWNAVGIAYAKVFQEKVVPQLKADTTLQFVRTAAQKAAASTPDPARVAPVIPGRPKSMLDAFKQVGLG